MDENTNPIKKFSEKVSFYLAIMKSNQRSLDESKHIATGGIQSDVTITEINKFVNNNIYI